MLKSRLVETKMISISTDYAKRSTGVLERFLIALLSLKQVDYSEPDKNGTLLFSKVLFHVIRIGAAAGPYPSNALRASITCWSWPSTWTRFQSLATLPLASIKYVDRWIPIDFLPYMFFSRQAPYFSAIL
jgi:hypothetical protein